VWYVTPFFDLGFQSDQIAGEAGWRGGRLPRIEGRARAEPILAAMSSNEPSIEHASDHCEECGAKLTAAEMEFVLESGGPTLCAVHAAEDEPGLAAEDAELADE